MKILDMLKIKAKTKQPKQLKRSDLLKIKATPKQPLKEPELAIRDVRKYKLEPDPYDEELETERMLDGLREDGIALSDDGNRLWTRAHPRPSEEARRDMRDE